MATQKKERLDRLLVSRGLAETRERAQAMIMSGSVEVNGVRADKAGKVFRDDATIRILEPPSPYVSRGGLKLEAALDHFQIQVSGRIALDVGSSTGGFTDCLLQRGVARLFAVDVGYGQLHLKIRNDPRVVPLERRNVRYLEATALDATPDLATIDVSFISLRLVLPVVVRLLGGRKEMLTLVKPQFEVGKAEVGKGGLVRDTVLHRRVLNEIGQLGKSLGLHVQAPFASPLKGAKGNQEYFLHFSLA
jgi:23S rRNA (cytidine1920-2'-O)/16S rRNA (cytidine1409-2'-O)-methyltransferase